MKALYLRCLSFFAWFLYTVVAKIIRTPDRSENIDFFASKIWFHFRMFMKHAVCCFEHNKYQMKWFILFLSTFYFNIWYVHLLQQLQQRIASGVVSVYFLRTSKLMLSHAFCNSSQRLSFEYTIGLSSLFSNSPQICSMGLMSGLWGGQSIIFNVPADSFHRR